MKQFESFSGKKNISWLAASAILLLFFICLYNVFASVRAGGNCGDTEYNLKLIQENLVDYTEVIAGEDTGWEPRKPSTFLLVHQEGGGEWILRYQSDRKLDKQQWTAEDLKGFDTVVIAKSSFKSEFYPSEDIILNNNAIVEHVTLLYYDIAAGEVVKTETISADLPKKIPEATGYDRWYRIAPSRITEKACGTLGVLFISDSIFRACRVTLRVTGIATAVLLLLWIRKLRSR